MRENRFHEAAQRAGGRCEPVREGEGVSFLSGTGEAAV